MAGKVLHVDDLITRDRTACTIADFWLKWVQFRRVKEAGWSEIRQYVTATDTTTTTNSKNPWHNKTTIPKLCQIRDNLSANYLASISPRRKNIEWIADESSSASKQKRDAIVNYMSWACEHPSYKDELSKIILDYIDYGNAFGTVDWEDSRNKNSTVMTGNYVGPVIRRISPLDIVFNPIVTSFEKSPKIVRSLVSMGEVKDLLERLTTDENKKLYEDLFKYMQDIRSGAKNHAGELAVKDEYFRVDGFTSFRDYLESDYVELLTFYGDIYDTENDKFLKNQIITVVDRHRIIDIKENPSVLGFAPIFHCGWRKRQDNLWAMGPLDNLVGMQYRIDHIENLKSDVFDFIAYPVQKVKGYVDDYVWGPGERIHVGDEGDVEIIAPPFQILQSNGEIQTYQAQMEEMAGAPKEAMGFRTPGEKTRYEVQRLENASSRIYQHKIAQFEEGMEEKLQNAMLELARRRFSGTQEIRVFDDEFKLSFFETLTLQDITGVGRIKPISARHFAEQAQLIQDLQGLTSGPVWEDIKVHFSTIKMAKLYERALDLTDYELVQPFVRISEEADAQRLAQAGQQQTMMEAGTPSGLDQYDFDLDPSQSAVGLMGQLSQGVPAV